MAENESDASLPPTGEHACTNSIDWVNIFNKPLSLCPCSHTCMPAKYGIMLLLPVPIYINALQRHMITVTLLKLSLPGSNNQCLDGRLPKSPKCIWRTVFSSTDLPRHFCHWERGSYDYLRSLVSDWRRERSFSDMNLQLWKFLPRKVHLGLSLLIFYRHHKMEL